MKAKSRNVVRMLAVILFAALCHNVAAASPKGVWLDDFAAATNSAFSTGTPLVLVASKAGCDHCAALTADCASASFKEWMSQEKFLFCHVGKNVNKVYDYVATAGETCEKIKSFPYVALIWPRGAEVVATNFVGRSGLMLASGGSLSAQLSKSVDAFFAEYQLGPSAYFIVSNSPSARLEASVGNAVAVSVPIRRRNATEAETYELKAVLPRDAGDATIPVAFETGAEMPTALPVVRTDAGAFEAGDVIGLELTCNGESVAYSSIVFTDVPTSTKNPLWIGERDAETLRPGEWTMDRDLALDEARAAGTFTLNLVGGSLWCPDCARTDRYFIETDAFEEWLAENRVYCSVIDIPRSTGKTCLLT